MSSSTAVATLPPKLRTEIPGPQSRILADRLRVVESRNITSFIPDLPIFWERAHGANVWDVDGNRYIDLTGAFGVANVGHAHPAVSQAVAQQAHQLLHAMGDVHPPAIKVELLERLCALYPGGGPARAILGSSGADAVEAALKTAILATGRNGVIAFEGGYHGLGFGALDLTFRANFKTPFSRRLPCMTSYARYGEIQDLERASAECPEPIGAVIVEPLQGRGGERVPPPGFLRALREHCDAKGWLLIADEVYTGFGRTGAWFACEHEKVTPDLLCVAKGLASGMPISACLGRAEIMDAWPISTGEALHTQTFLGHPAGCAAALASIDVLKNEGLVSRAAEVGERTLEWLRKEAAHFPSVADVRGRGLMLGIECDPSQRALDACRKALKRGIIGLPSGESGRVFSITPPLNIDEDRLREALTVVLDLLA